MSYFDEDALDGELKLSVKCRDDATRSATRRARKLKKKEEANICSYCCGYVRALWATRQTEDIDKLADPDKYVRITLRELFIYLVFLIFMTIISLGMVSSDTYNFTNLLINQFVTQSDPENNDLNFEGVRTIAHIFQNLENPILPSLYTAWYNGAPTSNQTNGDINGGNAVGIDEGPNFDPNNTLIDQDIGKYIQFENRVLGVARLRQIRVMGNSCVIPDDFKMEIKNCWSDWAPNYDDKTPFGISISQNITNETAWYYQSEKQLKGSSHQGYMNNYGGGGFVAPLSKDYATTMAILDDLKQNLWIDRGTRAVFLDFTVYNANLNLFCQVRLLYELPASGGVVPQSTFRTVKLLRYVTGFDYFILTCEICFAIMILYYVVEEFIEIKKHRKSYFHSFWNILDIIILCMGVIALVFSLFRQVKVNDTLESLISNDEIYIDFNFLCYWSVQYNNAMAFMVFLGWVKIFKYVSFNKVMTQLSLTLSRCAADVSGFAVMFFIVFTAYAQLGYLWFGTQIYDFSTFTHSLYTLFRIILGDFDFDSLEAANRVLGPIYFLSYVFFVFFVLLNMFIAIICDTYGEIKEELVDKKSDIELASYFKKGYHKVMDKLNLKRAQIIDIQKAITIADINNDRRIDFVEFRNSLRTKGYGDVEIETLFAKYDNDGDRCLNEIEQKNMLRDLSEQNDELKEAYKAIENNEEEGKENVSGVEYAVYSNLVERVGKMETSVKSIFGKVDAVLHKMDTMEKDKSIKNVTSAIKGKLHLDDLNKKNKSGSSHELKGFDAKNNHSDV